MSTQLTNTANNAQLRLWLVGALMLCLFLTGYFKRFDAIAIDLISGFLKREVPSNLVIVEIDSRSLQNNNQWPWDRKIYADVLKHLEKAGVNSVFVDIDFSSHSATESDELLAQSIQQLSETSVVRLPTFVQTESLLNRSLVFRSPISSIAENAELVAVNLQPEQDGMVRKAGAGFLLNDVFYTSAWNAIANKKPTVTYIDYSLDPSSFTYMSFDRVTQEGLAVGELRGKDVLIGSTAIELGDNVPVPNYKSLPGVVVQALAAETLVRGGLYQISKTTSVLLLIITALVASLLVLKANWLAAFVGVSSLGVVSSLAAIFAYQSLAVLLPVASLSIMAVSIFAVGLTTKLDFSVVQNMWLQNKIRYRENMLTSIFAASNDAILCIDDHGFISHANKRCADIFECSHEKLEGQSVVDIIPVLEEGWKNLGDQPFETEVIDFNFNEVPVEACISPVDMSGNVQFTLAMRDIKERREKEAALKYAATRDKLTGLYNREKFFELADKQMNENPVSALIRIDIDYFNEIVDVYGHEFGDKLIKIVADKIKEVASTKHILGRIGKDDFAALVVNKFTDEIKACAEKLLSELNKTLFIDDTEVNVYCHIGITKTSSKRSNIEELMKLGNIALQNAKEKGLDYDSYQSHEHPEQPPRLEIINLVKQGIENKTFELAFQPKVALDTKVPIGCEVLLRPPLSSRPDVNIGHIIEVAESTRLIADLTLFVVDRVLEQEKEWKLLSLPQAISINLSLGLVANDQFITSLIERLDSSIGYFNIEFEITETSFTHNWQRSIANIERLVKRSITISIDDFGTGYSSLSYLRDLKASVLKIDRSFITDIHSRVENQSIVQSTIKMAHELGMSVVAEGIETNLERDFLLACGCDFGQGYLFAKPLTHGEFSDWFQAHQSKNVVILGTKNKTL